MELFLFVALWLGPFAGTVTPAQPQPGCVMSDSRYTFGCAVQPVRGTRPTTPNRPVQR